MLSAAHQSSYEALGKFGEHSRSKNCSRRSLLALSKLPSLLHINLIDSLIKRSSKSYTWSQKLPNVFCRLDYWLISNNLQDFVKSTDIIPAIKTDHAAIALVFSDIGAELKGPGFRKINCSLLEDENYLNELKQKVPEWKVKGE